MKGKKIYQWFGQALLMLLAIVVSSVTGVCMAAATAMGGEGTDMADGGKNITNSLGGATATTGIEQTGDDDPDYFDDFDFDN